MSLIDDIRKDAEAGTPGPWAYRPQKFDDWGFVRRAVPDGEGWRHFICQAKTPMVSDETLNESRASGTDPWGVDARRIARVPAMEAALLTADAAIVCIDRTLSDYGKHRLPGYVRREITEAITAYRKATEATQ